jgi:Tfp pilus assembly protein PilF
MLIRLNLQNSLIRLASFVIALVIFGLLVKVIIGEFVVGTLSDKRININRELLTSTAGYFPASGRLFTRLAEFETKEAKVDFEIAEKYVQEAIKLSPNNYKYRLLLADIRDSSGDQSGAEKAFNEALQLAPEYSEVRWKTANFLVREKRVADSVEHFRIAAHSNPALFPAALDLVSAISDKNLLFLKRIVKDNQKGQLKLALLLAKQSRMSEAAEIFSKIDKELLFSGWEGTAFFDSMINQGYSRLAFDLWLQLKSGEAEIVDRSLIWNGDFETETDADLTHFDWRIGKSEFARIGFDGSRTRSGNRSLLFDFLGRDTTKLDNEVKHLIALQPGTSYRLEFYVKTDDLKTDEGPRIVVSDYSGKRIAQSAAVSAGTGDWKQMSVIFNAPQKQKETDDAAALFISVKRQPQYSYDAPTRGRIWFDDFSISEVNSK